MFPPIPTPPLQGPRGLGSCLCPVPQKSLYHTVHRHVIPWEMKRCGALERSSVCALPRTEGLERMGAERGCDGHIHMWAPRVPFWHCAVHSASPGMAIKLRSRVAGGPSLKKGRTGDHAFWEMGVLDMRIPRKGRLPLTANQPLNSYRKIGYLDYGKRKSGNWLLGGWIWRISC